MLFNSYIFIFVFLPLVTGGYWLLQRHQNLRHGWLLLASYAFYAYWNINYLPLIWLSTAIDFFVGWGIPRQTPNKRRWWLMASVVMNLGILGIFKYYDFFVNSINTSLDDPLLPLLRVALPVGISFYTFQSMSYTIDVYRGEVQPTSNPLRFALYITLFPQLVAGPIVRYSEVGEALNRTESGITWEKIDRGLFFFVIGLAKKVIIADQIAHFIDPMFAKYASLGLAGSWLVALGYSFQLYYDFSGYSDMAVGLGNLLGFDFPRNFNLPYAARNISDFWRRWHITLSNWLRDYLFVSLGGSRGSVGMVLRNLMITMLLGGLWHGAAWTFVVWGGYHGILLVLYHAYRLRGLPAWNPVFGQGSTFLAVLIGWVMFRSTSFEMAMRIYEGMLGLHGIESLDQLTTGFSINFYILGVIALAGLYANVLKIDTWDVALPNNWIQVAGLGLVFALCVALLTQPSPFLYFQF